MEVEKEVEKVEGRRWQVEEGRMWNMEGRRRDEKVEGRRWGGRWKAGGKR